MEQCFENIKVGDSVVFLCKYALALKRIRNDCAYCMKRAMTNTPSITLVVTHGLRYWIKSWGYFIKKRRMIKKRCHKCTEFQKCNIKYDI